MSLRPCSCPESHKEQSSATRNLQDGPACSKNARKIVATVVQTAHERSLAQLFNSKTASKCEDHKNPMQIIQGNAAVRLSQGAFHQASPTVSTGQRRAEDPAAPPAREGSAGPMQPAPTTQPSPACSVQQHLQQTSNGASVETGQLQPQQPQPPNEQLEQQQDLPGPVEVCCLGDSLVQVRVHAPAMCEQRAACMPLAACTVRKLARLAPASLRPSILTPCARRPTLLLPPGPSANPTHGRAVYLPSACMLPPQHLQPCFSPPPAPLATPHPPGRVPPRPLPGGTGLHPAAQRRLRVTQRLREDVGELHGQGT